MTVSDTSPVPGPFPGPPALGRGVVVGRGGRPPAGFPADAPRVRIDDEVLAHPDPAVAFLHTSWATRRPVVVELAVDNDALRTDETDHRPPWELPHGFTFPRERLHFLLWANNYDGRSGEPIWWHGELARRRGADPSQVADAELAGEPVWCDGGPRGPVVEDGAATGRVAGYRLVHRESIQRSRLAPLGEAGPGDHLAPDQLAAVAHHAGAARIVAPAGSGKTRVLTARLRHLLRDRGIESDLVTAVAYNTRAAQEMRDRLPDVRADVRTLHSLGLMICNLEARREIITERDQRAILDRLVRTAKIPNQDPFQPYLDALSEARLGLTDPEEVGPVYELDDFPVTFAAYREELQRRGAIDFDDQIFHALELLLTRPDLRRQIQQRCTHLLVDEFQDLTPAFHLLIRLVAAPSLEVFAVGDDDQVIYGYAGADPGYLIDFARDFPGAADHPLEVNYRCPPGVVDQAVRLLGHNQRRVVKTIRAGRAGAAGAGDGGAAASGGAVVHAVDAGAMAARTVALIADRLAEGAAPRDVAVLARVNAALLPVQIALGEAGIPRTAPLDTTVLGRTGVRTALAYLRLGLDPERMRREDVFDTLNRPARKVKSAVSELLRGARWSWDQLDQLTDSLGPAHADRWAGYLDDIQGLADAITAGADTAKVLWHIRNVIGLGEAMDTLDASRSRPEGSSHGDDLDALAQLAALHPDPVTFREWLIEALRVPGDPTA
jgi:DNA helicase II / ATP-dependent DNA helicase PcrA